MMIGAYKYSNVETCNVPGAYIQTDLPKYIFTLLLLEVNFVDIMGDINPKYNHHGKFKDGRNTFYLRIIKSIYGMIESALLWYELYLSVLKDMEFQLNPYDMCVVNKKINGKQCNIAWYVDDNKVSHVEQDVIYYVISKVV